MAQAVDALPHLVFVPLPAGGDRGGRFSVAARIENRLLDFLGGVLKGNRAQEKLPALEQAAAALDEAVFESRRGADLLKSSGSMPRKSAAFSAERLSPVVAGDKRVLFAYLFGSILRRKDARDIDLAVCLAENGDDWKTAQDIACRVEEALGRSAQVDAHALNAASPGFVFEVLSSGRLLYERNRDQRLDWEAHALSRYQDIRPMLDFYDRRYLGR